MSTHKDAQNNWIVHKGVNFALCIYDPKAFTLVIKLYLVQKIGGLLQATEAEFIKHEKAFKKHSEKEIDEYIEKFMVTAVGV